MQLRPRHVEDLLHVQDGGNRDPVVCASLPIHQQVLKLDVAVEEIGLGRKIENHMAAVAINYFADNFIKIHRTLRVTPAMAAGALAGCSM